MCTTARNQLCSGTTVPQDGRAASRKAIMLTQRHVLAGMTGLVLTVAVVSTASAAGRHSGSEKGGSHENLSRSQFSGPTCDVPPNGHGQFVNSRNPFAGSSRGAYGHIFFAGGASMGSHEKPPRSPVAGSPVSPVVPAATGAPPAVRPTVPGAPGAPSPPAPIGPALPTAPINVGGTPVVGALGGEPVAGAVGSPGGAGDAPAAVGNDRPLAVNPEPASLLLMCTGLSTVLLARRRQRKQRD